MSLPPSSPDPTGRSSERGRITATAVLILRTVRRRRVVSIVLAAGFLLWAGFCLLIAMPPWGALLVLLLVAGLSLLAHRVTQRGRRTSRASDARVIATVAVAAMVTMLVIQFVPYGRDRSAPVATGEPVWADDATRALMVRACFGCHSSEVEYPGYASVAPISWMVQSHIDEGRGKVNYSQFATNPRKADETIEVILEGEMPPYYYTLFGRHPEARLTEGERAQLIEGLRATPGMDDGS